VEIEIKEETDFKKIFQIADRTDSELTKLDTITPIFVAHINDEPVGILGFRTGFKGYIVVDLLNALPKHERKEEIMKRLVDFMIDYVKNQGIKKIHGLFPRIADYLKEVGFKEIKISELPEDFYSDCMQCEKRGKDCFPLAMEINL